MTAASVAWQATRWTDDLADVLRAGIRAAERCGVISVEEGEQLLARLVVVLDEPT